MLAFCSDRVVVSWMIYVRQRAACGFYEPGSLKEVSGAAVPGEGLQPPGPFGSGRPGGDTANPRICVFLFLGFT